MFRYYSSVAQTKDQYMLFRRFPRVCLLFWFLLGFPLHKFCCTLPMYSKYPIHNWLKLLWYKSIIFDRILISYTIPENQSSIEALFIPAGHVAVLQLCCSVEESLQALPPFSSWVSTFLVRTCTPPPQVLLQVAHESHVPHTQFTRQIDKIYSYYQKLFVNKMKNYSIPS